MSSDKNRGKGEQGERGRGEKGNSTPQISQVEEKQSADSDVDRFGLLRTNCDLKLSDSLRVKRLAVALGFS